MTSRLASLLVVAGVLALVMLPARPAAAHPLGNFTTNTFAGLTVTPEGVAVDFVLDLAEIPALRVVQELDADGDGAVSPAESRDWVPTRCREIADSLRLATGGERVPLEVVQTALTFPPGEAALATLRLECGLFAEAALTGGPVTFRDGTFDDRVGWREVTAEGRGVELATSDVPATSVSDRLRSYPQDRLASPLAVREASFTVGSAGAGGVAPALVPEGEARDSVDRLTTAFTGLVAARELTTGFALVAVAVALGLGALHALAPGHGKTVMAAYLVSREGRAPQAVGLALTVAVAHTAGVLLLGTVLTVTEVLAPQRLYAWLGVASGLLFAAVGAALLRGVLTRRGAHGHDHAHDVHDHHTHVAHPGWRSLVAPGLAGGLVPTPSALVVLLGGIALGRAWFGVTLVVAYGLGMGGALVAVGWLLLRVRGRFAAVAAQDPNGRLAHVTAALPVLTACLVVLAGLAIAARAAVAL